jgi:hypothetical protein
MQLSTEASAKQGIKEDFSSTQEQIEHHSTQEHHLMEFERKWIPILSQDK